jgi:CubicO group peptidase (beta-lactamase class C family)
MSAGGTATRPMRTHDRATLFVLFIALVTAPPWSRAAELSTHDFADDRVLADLPAHWAAQMELFHVPGAAIAVVHDGKVFVATIGIRDPESHRPITPNTMFYIASVTKTFNAMAVCALADDGRLSLDDPVREYLPEFHLPPGNETLASTISLRDLMCHRYGIDSDEIVSLDAYTGDITEKRYWYWLPRGEVAGHTKYSNVHYTLIGRVIERVSGMDWRDWLEQRILQPAGMTRTTGYASRLYGDDDCAIPMEWTDSGFSATAQRKTDRTMHAAGGLGLSILDGARWILLNLDDGRIDDRQIVSAERVRSMRTEQSSFEPEGTIRVMNGFGLGWQRGTYVGTPLFAHGGGYTGTSAYVALHPEQHAGFLVLVDAGEAAQAWTAAVSVDLSRALTGLQPPWEPWERFGEEMRKRAARPKETPAAPGVTAADLSRPMGLYTGTFRNEWLGTLIVTREGGELRFAFGDSPESTAPGTKPDVFLVGGIFHEGSTGEFVVEPTGTIERVRIVDAADGETFVFER